MLRQNAINRIALVCGVVLSLMAAVPASARQGTAREPRSAQEIRRVLGRQVEAWNRRDLEGFMQGYWHSPELTFYSGGTVVSGWETTLARYRNRYQGEGHVMRHLDLVDLLIELVGRSVAFV